MQSFDDTPRLSLEDGSGILQESPKPTPAKNRNVFCEIGARVQLCLKATISPRVLVLDVDMSRRTWHV